MMGKIKVVDMLGLLKFFTQKTIERIVYKQLTMLSNDIRKEFIKTIAEL
jgi:hypothetical protein